MKRLWNPPAEIQASGFRFAARRFGQNGARRQGFALPRQTPPRSCLPCAVLQRSTAATGGSDGKQKQSSFFVLRKTRTSVQ
jgi:hypothetical protein